MTNKMNIASLTLFNSIYVEADKNSSSFSKKFLGRTVPRGYLITEDVPSDESTLRDIESVIGISGEKANATFHKSWSVVKDASMEQLVIQQILHYITTYGFEELGKYDFDTVYIPNEALELPEITDKIPLTVVKAMNSAEILDGILDLCSSGIALSNETLDNMMVLVEEIGYKQDAFLGFEIKNREFKARIYNLYDIAPSEPTEFLRYLISKLTGESLLIKNSYLIERIKSSNGITLDKLIAKAPLDLASIFLRYKPLFLAMKSISHNKTFFNNLRRKAVTMHEPLGEDYLNSITKKISSGKLNMKEFNKKLSNATVFRKIRLAYALNNRLSVGDSIVYKVRNGKAWVGDFSWDKSANGTVRIALANTLSSIADSVRDNIEGEIFYIPENINYAMPATEK